jgi:DNA-binding MarR family transcriptional regulator
MERKDRWHGWETPDDFTLWRILDHTEFMISRTREVELARFGMTPEQSQILDILNESGGSTTINELVNITQRQHHSISTLIERMYKQRLVTKKKSGTDKRQYEVVITQKGKELLKSMTRDSIRAIFASLTKEEMDLLKVLLMRLADEAYKVSKKEL